MVIIEHIPQSVVHHGVHHGGIAHAVAVAGVFQSVGSHGHILHTAGDHDIGLPCLDHGGSHVHAVQTGTADNINCHGRSLHRNPGFDGSLSCHVLAQTSLDDAAHVDLIYLIHRDSCPIQRFLDHDGAQIRSRGRA